jgi:hypothetical protein
MRHRLAGTTLLILLVALAGMAILAGCEVDYREAGRQAGELAQEAEATVAEGAPTVAAEVQTRAPTVAAEAAEAARDFSEGVQESGACSGAAMILVCGSLIVAAGSRRQT